MTKLKREMRKRGFKFEEDFMWLPYEMGSVTLEGVSMRVVGNLIYYTRYYTSIVCTQILDKNYQVVDERYL